MNSLIFSREIELESAIDKAPLPKQPKEIPVAVTEKTEPKAEPAKPVEKSVDKREQPVQKPAQAPVQPKQTPKADPKPEPKQEPKPQAQNKPQQTAPAAKPTPQPAKQPAQTSGGGYTANLVNYVAKFTDAQSAKLYVDLAVQTGQQYGIDPLWLLAMMETESTFNKNAVSSDGARGLMQFLPSTAKGLGVSDPSRLHDPRTSVNLSATYLADLTRRTGSLKMATVAYNQGIGNVQRGTYKTWYYDKVSTKHRNLKALNR